MKTSLSWLVALMVLSCAAFAQKAEPFHGMATHVTTPSFSVTLRPSGSSNGIAPAFILVTNVLSQKSPAAPLPGLYQARPYSALVVVPKPVDRRSVFVPPTNYEFTMRSVEPPVCLEPKQLR